MILASESRSGRRHVCREQLAFAGLLAFGLLCATPAWAEDAETRTAARDLATQGGQAFDAGQYDRASDFFLRAYDLVQAPSIALMRARSLAKLNQWVEAIDVYEQTARFKLPADAPDAYVKAVETARVEVEDVRRRMPRLKISLTHADPERAPEVTIDDKPTPAALLGVERPMNPGPHRVELRLGGERRALRELELEPGQSYDVELDATPTTAAGGAQLGHRLGASGVAAQASPGAESATSSLRPSRILGYSGLGLGIVGLAVGTYTGVVALHHKSRLDEVCHPGCPQSSAQDLSGFRSNRTASWVSYGVGVAAATSGILLLTLGDPKRESVALSALPFGIEIGGRL